MQAQAQTVKHLDGITLYSPYGDEGTKPFAGAVVDQSALVRPLFADAGQPPVRFYLVPAPKDDDGAPKEIWAQPDHGGVLGTAHREGFVCVYVRAEADPQDARIHAVFAASTIRHELAHAHARRAGLERAPWFNEGLALEVEGMRASPDGLVLHPFPAALIGARQSAEPGTVRELLGWVNTGASSIELRRRRYCESEALFRFLFDHAGEATWIAGARAVHDLDDASIVALEPAWLAWLGRQNALEAVRAGTRSSKASERAEAASWMPGLAERGASELSTRAADELALELLSDPSTWDPAATFLFFFRAHELTEADLADLCRSSEPARSLTGLALRRRRGERVDPKQAYVEWTKVPAADRPRLESIHSMLELSASGR